VAELCLQVGEQLRLSENDLRNVVKAAFLHDIGKTRIPANILNTPGPLSKEQWEKVKMHPIWGSEIFNEDATIQKGIITHHENYDGTGYPFGLKNEDIHIIGRIIAIADSIDAMTTIRPYRKPISMSQAINKVQEYSGVKYDPYVVKSLCNISFVRKAQAK
jgi:HD-GYP domain-containing protein (c-di-GMP phosphodiesterase class II)